MIGVAACPPAATMCFQRARASIKSVTRFASAPTCGRLLLAKWSSPSLGLQPFPRLTCNPLETTLEWSRRAGHIMLRCNGVREKDGDTDASVDSSTSGAWDKDELMQRIKSYGLAGTLSYIITELAFWAVAIPAAAYSYHSSTGEWLDLATEKAKLLGIAVGFVTLVRFAVPLRMAAALALTPVVDRTIVKRFQSGEQ